MLVKHAINGFLQALETDGKSPRTIDTFQRDLARFAAWIASEKGIAKIENINTSLLRQYLAANSSLKNGETKKAATINREKAGLRGLFAWAVREGHISESPAAAIKLAAVDNRRLVYLIESEEKALVKAVRASSASAHGERDLAIVLVLLDTGVRVGELVNLKQKDFSDSRLTVRRKGGREDAVYLSERARKAVLAYRRGERKRYSVADDTPLFVNQKNGPLQERSVQRLVAKYAKRAGIAKPVTPHTLRHTFATSLYRRERDIYLVKEALGHASIQNTMIYAHMEDSALVNAVEERSRQ